MLSRLRRPAVEVPTEEEALPQLRKAIEEHEASTTPLAKQWLTEECLQRYLRARSLSVVKATDMLVASLEWRASYRTDTILEEHEDTLRKEASSGKMFVLPSVDRSGHAVIVMRPGLENSSDAEANIRYLVYTLERAAAQSKSGRFTVIVDYFTGNMSVSTAPSFSVMKQTTSILQNQYPERLGACFFYDAPRFVVGLLKMLRPFIDPVTREKMFFAKSATAAESEDCKRLLDLENTPEAYGGSLQYDFNADEYFTAGKKI